MSDTSAEYTGNLTDRTAWKAYPTMYVMAETDINGMTPERGITVRVVDIGAGPYLALTGFNLNPDEPNENPHEFYLGTHDQIDSLAGTLHDLLRAAEETDQ